MLGIQSTKTFFSTPWSNCDFATCVVGWCWMMLSRLCNVYLEYSRIILDLFRTAGSIGIRFPAPQQKAPNKFTQSPGKPRCGGCASQQPENALGLQAPGPHRFSACFLGGSMDKYSIHRAYTGDVFLESESGEFQEGQCLDKILFCCPLKRWFCGTNQIQFLSYLLVI